MLLHTRDGLRLDPDAPPPARSLWAQWTLALGLAGADPIPWSSALAWLERAEDPDAVALAHAVHERLGLPELGRARVHLDNDGALGRASFEIQAELRDGTRRVHLEDGRPTYVDPYGRRRLIDAPSWALLQAARQAPPPPDERDEAQYRWWAELRQLADRAGASLSTYLSRQRVAVLDRPAAVLRADGDAIHVGLQDDGVDPATAEQLLDGWTPANARRAVRTLATPEGRTRVVTTPNGRRALAAVAARRTFRGAEAAALAENPERVLDPELFDLSAYSERVITIGPPRYRATVTRAGDAGPRDWRSGLDETLQLHLQDMTRPDAPPVVLELSTREDRQQVREAVQQADARDQDFADIQGHHVRLDPEVRAVCGALRDESSPAEATDPIERPPELAGHALHIKENVDALEHGDQVRVSGVPAHHQLTLPHGLAPDVRLREHQREGVLKLSWWTDAASDPIVGGLLADDMGLGKTLQVLVVLALLAERDALRPSLVVAPVALLENWRREAQRFVPGAIQRVALLSDLPRGYEHTATSYDLVLTSYETLWRRDLELGRIDWQVVVADEAQKIKNPTTRAAHALKAMKCRHRIAMTGTPVENNLDELWSIADFFQPGVLGALNAFRDRYASSEVLADASLREQAASDLRQRLEPLMLRRMKEDVAKDLPSLHVHEEPVELSDVQRQLYRVVHQGMAHGDVLGTIQRLLQVCAHPALATTSKEAAHLPCPKLDWTLGVLDRARAAGEKALIFARYLDLQRLLKEAIDHRYGLDVPILNGSVPPPDRQRVVDAFSREPGFDVLVLSARSCGVGLNITAANHVIHYTREWNPAIEAQATDRAYRIGQTRDVHVWIPVVTAPDFTTAEVSLATVLQSKEALRRDFIQPSAALKIQPGQIAEALTAPPGPPPEPQLDDIDDAPIARQLAEAATGRKAQVDRYPWATAAQAAESWWLVVRDVNAFLASEPLGAPSDTTLVLRAPLGWFARGVRNKLRARGSLTEVGDLPAALSSHGVTEASLRLPEVEPAPAAPSPATPAAAPPPPAAPTDPRDALRAYDLHDLPLDDRDLALLARLLDTKTRCWLDELADWDGRSPAQLEQIVPRIHHELRRDGAAYRVQICRDEDERAYVDVR